MRTFTAASAAAAALLIGTAVQAEPLELTAVEMDRVTAGKLVLIVPPGSTGPIEIAKSVGETTTILAGNSGAEGLPTLGPWEAGNAESDVVMHITE